MPVNYTVDRDELLFRTAEGSKLLGVVINGNVAFEVEEVGAEVARTVVARGRARQLDEHEAHRIEQLPLHNWVPGERYDVVAIAPSSLTGREFPLVRPWTHLRVEAHAPAATSSSTHAGTSEVAGPWREPWKRAAPSLGSRLSSSVRAPRAGDRGKAGRGVDDTGGADRDEQVGVLQRNSMRRSNP